MIMLKVLILGVGNILMGDEGIGIHVARSLEGMGLPEGVVCLDGGTGGFHLLGAIRQAEKVILVDATKDGSPPGTVERLTPAFSSDYPTTLSAHDIGLKELLDAVYLLGDSPQIVLYAISIGWLQNLSPNLSAPLSRQIGNLASAVLQEAQNWF
jgi:hydrogenase maturation protease